MAALSANINAVAMLRNRRDLPWPDLIDIGRLALQAGAIGLTVHPRPDERHVRASDVPAIATLIAREFPGRELNIEGYPNPRFLTLVEEIKPTQVTLVPDDPIQATSDHGWDFQSHLTLLQPIVDRLHQHGARVAVFCDADPDDAERAAKTGADRIEIYTGPYGATFNDPAAASDHISMIAETASAAEAAGLGVNAGHDLTLDNLPPLIVAAPQIAEVSIGHALTADCLRFGVTEAVRRYIEAARG